MSWTEFVNFAVTGIRKKYPSALAPKFMKHVDYEGEVESTPQVDHVELEILDFPLEQAIVEEATK